jgi:hypothetical protein
MAYPSKNKLQVNKLSNLVKPLLKIRGKIAKLTFGIYKFIDR